MEFEADLSEMVTKAENEGFAVQVTLSFLAKDPKILTTLMELSKLHGRHVVVNIRENKP